MGRLTDNVKRRIVEHLACYYAPREVAVLIEEEFGLRVPARQIRAYDPTSFQFAASQHWADLHAATRERFRKEVAAVPITYRAFRLRSLQRMFDDAFERGENRLARQLLEQAAKEMGNWYVR